MFFVFKKRTLIAAAAVFAGLIALIAVLTSAARPAADAGLPESGFTVVLDAGHGGIDSGVQGVKTKVNESDLNLAVTKRLEKHFKNYGVNTVLTRKDKNGLYGISSRNRKVRDMEKRKEIITAAGRSYYNDRLEKRHGQHCGSIRQAHPKSLHRPGHCPRFDAA